MEINILGIQKKYRETIMAECLSSCGEIVIYDVLYETPYEFAYIYTEIKIKENSTAKFLSKTVYDDNRNVLEVCEERIATINNETVVDFKTNLDNKVKEIYDKFDKRRQEETDCMKKPIMVLRS